MFLKNFYEIQISSYSIWISTVILMWITSMGSSFICLNCGWLPAHFMFLKNFYEIQISSYSIWISTVILMWITSMGSSFICLNCGWLPAQGVGAYYNCIDDVKFKNQSYLKELEYIFEIFSFMGWHWGVLYFNHKFFIWILIWLIQDSLKN
jgi:hypothetical protein